MLRTIGRRLVAPEHEDVAQRIRVEGERTRIDSRREQRQEGWPLACGQVIEIFGGQLVPVLRRRDELELGSIRELHVLVGDPILVRTTGLEREPERAVIRGRAVQIAHRDRDVVEARDGRWIRGQTDRRRQRQRHREPGTVHSAHDANLIRGASPLGLPDTLSRAPLRRRAPFAWLTRCRSFADAGQPRRGL